ncbi:MAG TPA: M15 family metallopeptidase [Candidatus Limnocylindria bacterium]|nr:M15 family metallopeptidase [Candidatus Limnocylindria bacterium]
MSSRAGALATLLLLTACAAQAPVPATATARPSRAAVVPPRTAGTGPELVAGAGTIGRPAQAPLAPTYRLSLLADHCVDRDLATPAVDDPALTILDRTYALAADHVPADLVPASEAGFTDASATKRVSAALVADLAAMREAWTAAGLTISVESAYRSYAAQEATFNLWVARVGLADATLRTARPGHSEHQLGTALDLTSPGWSGRIGDWAVESAEGAWMVEHGWEYGFVMSYPAGAEAVTCFAYEPWHWRWIGREAAAAQHESGVPLREHLVRMADA